jgi:hypothetical protein
MQAPSLFDGFPIDAFPTLENGRSSSEVNVDRRQIVQALQQKRRKFEMKDATEFWQAVEETAYAMEGQSKDYKRKAMARLSQTLDGYLLEHPADPKSEIGFAMHAVARLAGAFWKPNLQGSFNVGWRWPPLRWR